jgi:hypothetical protein
MPKPSAFERVDALPNEAKLEPDAGGIVAFYQPSSEPLFVTFDPKEPVEVYLAPQIDGDELDQYIRVLQPVQVWATPDQLAGLESAKKEKLYKLEPGLYRCKQRYE